MNQILAQGSSLDLAGVLKDLVSDGLINQSDAADIATTRRSRDEALLHPLEIIAAKQLVQESDLKPLSVDLLTQWLA